MPTTEYLPYSGTHACADIDTTIDEVRAARGNESSLNARITSDVATLNTAIEAKANSSDMATALAAKADKTTVNAALATKADADDVTTALATKANASDVTTALESKADVSDLSTLSGEVTDARTAEDGTTHQTLKGRLDAEELLTAKSNASALASCDLNDITDNGIWLLTSGNTYNHLPTDVSDGSGYLFSFALGGWNVQLFIPFVQKGIYRRKSNALNPWNTWDKITTDDELTATVNDILEFNRYDVISKNAIRTDQTDAGVSYTWTGDVCSISGTPSGSSFCNVFNSSLSDSRFKADSTYYLVMNDAAASQVFIRIYYSSNGTSYDNYVNIEKSGYFTIPSGTVKMIIRFQVKNGVTNVSCSDFCYVLNYAPIENYPESQTERLMSCDINTLHGNKAWLIANNQTYTNLPSDKNHTVGYLFLYEISGWRLQLFIPFTWTGIYRRATNGGDNTWQAWVQIAESGGGGDTYYVTNNYEVTATPSITADTNDYLAPTGDNTDVKLSIVSMLSTNGVCRLGAGDYYVSGVDMPDDTMLIGSGAKTRVILLGDGSTTGYAIKLGNRCSVKDMSIVGSTTDIRYDSVSSSIVDRHGILFEAQYSVDESHKDRCNIENVWIRFFTGGGITCRNTGYGTASCVNASNVYIYQCNAGIYVPYWSEFHRFTNVHAHNCYYGAVNNGGNCSFVNCGFSANRVGMYMDNSSDQSPNNSHGQVVACIFDHADANNGVGILIEGQKNGEVFSDCQVFYSDIVVRNSAGIQFNNFNIGGGNVDISIEKGINSGLVIFNGCVFASGSYTISVDAGYDACKFVNCWTRSGTAITV